MAGSGELGRLVRGLREMHNLSQTDLARRAGISRTHLSAVELGKAWPSLPNWCAMMRVVAPGLDWTNTKAVDDELNYRRTWHEMGITDWRSQLSEDPDIGRMAALAGYVIIEMARFIGERSGFMPALTVIARQMVEPVKHLIPAGTDARDPKKIQEALNHAGKAAKPT